MTETPAKTSAAEKEPNKPLPANAPKPPGDYDFLAFGTNAFAVILSREFLGDGPERPHLDQSEYYQ